VIVSQHRVSTRAPRNVVDWARERTRASTAYDHQHGQVELIMDLVEPGVRRSRAERTATLPGVPIVGDTIDVARMLTLKVASVRWTRRHRASSCS
jgi:hypothetical protein